MGQTLTLHEAAEELGVHYMTAYRYVRHGLLAATKVGGTWQVEQGAIERFQNGDQAPVEPGGRAPWSDRLESRLMAGDAAGSWGVVESALAAGTELDALYLDVISPAMVTIGERWAAGEIDIIVEHVASGIVMRMIGRLGHRFTRRGRTRGGVAVGAPAGEAHALPVAILGDLLRLRGWDVIDLGADVPPGSWSHAVSSAPDLVAVGISVTTPDATPAAAAACAAVRAARPEVKIVLGGLGVAGQSHAEELGADGQASSGAEMNALLDGWVGKSS